jgi:hypothetical protein
MIEASSPLAAMQPPAFGMGLRGGGFADAPRSYASYAAAKPFGAPSFNFRDLSMKKAQPDYFSLKPVRGSSPTASLAADLSQNFHIDQRYTQACGNIPSVATLTSIPALNYRLLEDLSSQMACLHMILTVSGMLTLLGFVN